MDQEKLKAIIESILFVSSDGISLSKIAKITDFPMDKVEEAVVSLQDDYEKKSGLVIIRKEQELQMATHPENAFIVERLIKSEIQENLSKAALEVLAIIAYRGPLTRLEVEAIRGVNCSFTVRALLMRGLLERMDNPKDSRGYLYKISFDFLKKLGLKNISDLPDYEILSKDDRIDSIIV